MRNRREALVLYALQQVQRRKNRAVYLSDVVAELAAERHEDIHTEAILRQLITHGDVMRGMEPGTYLAV